jgi:hypothetical protein
MKRIWILSAAGLLLWHTAAPAQNPARQFSQFGAQRATNPIPLPGTVNNMPRVGGYLGGTGGTIPTLPNTFNPGALNPGALNPGALNPGAFNPGAFNPGAFNPGAFNPGAFNPGAFNPGALNSGAFPPGFNPGAFNPYANNPFAWNNAWNNPYGGMNPYNTFATPYGYAPFGNQFNPYQTPWGYPASPFGNPFTPYAAPWQNPLVNPSLLGVTGSVAPWQYPQLPFQNPALMSMWGLGAFGSALSNSGSDKKTRPRGRVSCCAQELILPLRPPPSPY